MTKKMKQILGLVGMSFSLLTNATNLDSLTFNNALGSQQVYYENIDGDAIAEGDIILGRVDELKGQGAVIIPKTGDTRWNNGVIAFEIDEAMPLMNKLAILQAIVHWQKNTYVEFVELNSKNRYDYKDYLRFVPAKGTTCSSYVGKQGGSQEIKLAPRCNTGNTIHEIGHALGFWHEQSRADRSAYLRIEWDNIDSKHAHNFDIHLTDGKDFGVYDYNSIMHYGPYAFSKNGKKTLIPLDEQAVIGQREGLSEKDILAAKAMYPQA